MTPTKLHALIAALESQTLEFKSSFDKVALQSLVAFEFDSSIPLSRSAGGQFVTAVPQLEVSKAASA